MNYKERKVELTENSETQQCVLRGMRAEDEQKPLRREQLFSGTATGQISKCMKRGTSKAWVHTLTHKHPKCELIQTMMYMSTSMDAYLSISLVYHMGLHCSSLNV